MPAPRSQQLAVAPDVPTLLVTVRGPDRPGVTTRLFEALSAPDVRVLDVEQVVVRGNLTLAVLVTAPQDTGTLIAAATRVGKDLGMKVRCVTGTGDNRPRKRGRLAVTLMGAPLTPVTVSEISATIARHDANIDRIRRLSRDPVTTVELEVSGADAAVLRRDLVREAAVRGVDVAVSPSGLARRGRRLVVMDVDSTLIRDEVIELLARHAGREEEVAAVTEAAMAGELDFAESLHRRVAVLEGLDVRVLAEVREQVRLTPGARTLCRTLRRLGFTLGLVSGGFAEVVEPLGRELDCQYVRANRLEVADGRLTGRVDGPVVDREGKAAALREFAAAEGLSLARTVAIGDGANDLDMLAEAGLGVAFNAKPLVRAQAQTSVNVPYLDTVLYLLGISREEVEDADAVS
jgi:phosphoserine phosphatase